MEARGPPKKGYRLIRDEEDYHRVLEENEYVFVIYSASWCKPCQSLKAMLDRDFVDYPHPIVVVDVEELEELADGISGLPTMVGHHNKQEYIRTTGFDPQKQAKVFQDAIQQEKTEETNHE